MRQTVFIFHGTAGHPKENWFPWLKEKLEQKGLEVIVPQFPTPEGQSLKAWLNVFNQFEDKVNEQTIIVGHSLGGIFTLRLLERFENPIKAVFLTGTPIGVKPIKNWVSDVSFSGFVFDWDKIKSNAKHFTAFHSDNDPYVGLGNGEKLAKELGVKLTFIPNAGHFNASAGYTKFEKLWELISRELG